MLAHSHRLDRQQQGAGRRRTKGDMLLLLCPDFAAQDRARRHHVDRSQCRCCCAVDAHADRALAPRSTGRSSRSAATSRATSVPLRRPARAVPDRRRGRRVGTPRALLLHLRAHLVGEQAVRDRRRPPTSARSCELPDRPGDPRPRTVAACTPSGDATTLPARSEFRRRPMSDRRNRRRDRLRAAGDSRLSPAGGVSPRAPRSPGRAAVRRAVPPLGRRSRRLLGRDGHAARAGARPWTRVLDWQAALRQVVRRRAAERLRQLPRPPPGRAAPQQGRHHLGGRARGETRVLTYQAAPPRGLPLRERAEATGRQEGRPRRHLPADDPRGGHRDAGLRAHRRDALRRLRRLLGGGAPRPHERRPGDR